MPHLTAVLCQDKK